LRPSESKSFCEAETRFQSIENKAAEGGWAAEPMHGFGKGILAAEDDRHAHCQNGNGSESINGLADFQAEIADGKGKHGGIKKPPENDVAVDFHVVFVGVHHGLDGQYFL